MFDLIESTDLLIAEVFLIFCVGVDDIAIFVLEILFLGNSEDVFGLSNTFLIFSNNLLPIFFLLLSLNVLVVQEQKKVIVLALDLSVLLE